MGRVILESPLAGQSGLPASFPAFAHGLSARLEERRNERYARRAMRELLKEGYAPFASHLIYAQPGVLDDGDPQERKIGMEAGFRWIERADRTVVYLDRGVSSGMRAGIEAAREAGRPIEYRKLGAGVSSVEAPDASVSGEHGDPASVKVGSARYADGDPRKEALDDPGSRHLHARGWEFVPTGPDEWEWVKFGPDGKRVASQCDGVWAGDVADAPFVPGRSEVL